MPKIEFKRFERNPIISPTDNWWETKATFNAGVAKYQGKIILLYRAIGNDGISRLGYAESNNGKDIEKRLDQPVAEPALDDPFERMGIEDPRITKIGGTYWITVTAVSLYEANFITSLIEQLNGSHRDYAPWRARASLLKTQDFINYEKVGRVFGEEDDKDVIIFPEKIKGKYVILDRLLPDITVAWADKIEGKWSERKIVLKPQKGWEEERVGIAAPPIKTNKGWLIIYHGVDRKRIYCLGFAFSDINDPTKIIYRHPDPILKPEKNYEKKGRVPNVVFSCGMVEKNDELYLYYGGADKVLAVATIDKNEILGVL